MRKVIGVLTAAALIALAGCGGPYKGKPEKLPKVKKSTPPPEVASADPVVEIKYDEECSAKFTDDPNKAKKSSSKAGGFIAAGNDNISRAGSSTDPAVQVDNIIRAIEQYKKALLEDHYNPEATFYLAVAYAQVRKKGCALKLLKRLGELAINPRLAGGQSRLDAFLNLVEDEAAFKPFKNDAMQAIGR
jgi:predicted small lipoprotein YifL